MVKFMTRYKKDFDINNKWKYNQYLRKEFVESIDGL